MEVIKRLLKTYGFILILFKKMDGGTGNKKIIFLEIYQTAS